MDRVINVRQLECFNTEAFWLTLLCVRIAKQTSINHLQTLDATARKAQVDNEHVASFFFDMEKAYDLK